MANYCEAAFIGRMVLWSMLERLSLNSVRNGKIICKLMDLLCKQYSNKLEFVDKDIEKLYTTNSILTFGTAFNEREESLKKYLESFVGNLLQTKEN